MVVNGARESSVANIHPNIFVYHQTKKLIVLEQLEDEDFFTLHNLRDYDSSLRYGSLINDLIYNNLRNGSIMHCVIN